jgi:hypothetical protein
MENLHRALIEFFYNLEMFVIFLAGLVGFVVGVVLVIASLSSAADVHKGDEIPDFDSFPGKPRR